MGWVPIWGLGFSGFFMFVVLHDVWGDKRLFEAAINLAQFPEDQNKENRNHEQQELDVHLFLALSCQGIVNAQAFYYSFCPQEANSDGAACPLTYAQTLAAA